MAKTSRFAKQFVGKMCFLPVLAKCRFGKCVDSKLIYYERESVLD